MPIRAIAVSHVRTETIDSTHVLQPHFLYCLKKHNYCRSSDGVSVDEHVISSEAIALSYSPPPPHHNFLIPRQYPDHIYFTKPLYTPTHYAFVCVIMGTLYTQLPHAHAKNMLRRRLHTLSSAIVSATVIVSNKYSAVVAVTEKREQFMAASKSMSLNRRRRISHTHARTRSSYISARRHGRIKEI
ncbi:hypothetical protein QTP88_007355 [Uroleucon formosanum]